MVISQRNKTKWSNVKIVWRKDVWEDRSEDFGKAKKAFHIFFDLFSESEKPS
jgi:hypothetical protein